MYQPLPGIVYITDPFAGVVGLSSLLLPHRLGLRVLDVFLRGATGSRLVKSLQTEGCRLAWHGTRSCPTVSSHLARLPPWVAEDPVAPMSPTLPPATAISSVFRVKLSSTSKQGCDRVQRSCVGWPSMNWALWWRGWLVEGLVVTGAVGEVQPEVGGGAGVALQDVDGVLQSLVEVCVGATYQQFEN